MPSLDIDDTVIADDKPGDESVSVLVYGFGLSREMWSPRSPEWRRIAETTDSTTTSRLRGRPKR